MSALLCARCQKMPELCVCSSIASIDTKHKVLILQHPQEPDKELGSARLAHLCLPGSRLAIGLSWPNLKKAWGEETDPREWIVLYLGSAKPHVPRGVALVCVDRKGKVRADSTKLLEQSKGLVLIDGTWSQAKTLWWRNAWLTKLKRAVLVPPRPSLYGKLRREPRREGLSTIEAAAYSLAELEHAPQLVDQLLAPFKLLLQKAAQRH